MARKRHKEQCLSASELLTFGQQEWAGGATRLWYRCKWCLCQPIGGILDQNVPTGRVLHWMKWLSPCSIPLLHHLLGYPKRNVIFVTTADHWPHLKRSMVPGGTLRGILRLLMVVGYQLITFFEGGQQVLLGRESWVAHLHVYHMRSDTKSPPSIVYACVFLWTPLYFSVHWPPFPLLSYTIELNMTALRGLILSVEKILTKSE